MRIVKLVFENLASLTGKWTIDFQNESFRENGIFAIIGPTGSGKTTILDAITLALYAKTDRLGSSFNEMNNEIMSQSENSCMASVDFTTPGGYYRATFEHRRTTKKNAVKPFSKAKWSLCSIDENGNIKEDLTPPKEKEKFQTEIIGMDFDQFTRSVILPQGKFQEFLKADGEKKSALLEKITGTQIYRIIGLQVFEKRREVSANLGEARNNAVFFSKQLLSEEKIASINTIVNDLPGKIEIKKKEEKNLQCIIQWLEDIEKLEKELSDLQKEENSLHAYKNEIVPSNLALQRDEKARPFVTENSFLSEEERSIQEEKDKLKESKDRLQDFNALYLETVEKKKRAKTDQEKAESLKNEANPKILTARNYNTKLDEFDKQCIIAENNLNAETKNLNDLKNRISKLEQTKIQSEKLKNKKNELEKTKKDEFGDLTAFDLASQDLECSNELNDWHNLKNSITDINELTDQLNKENSLVENAKEKLEELKKEESSQQEQDMILSAEIEKKTEEAQLARTINQLDGERLKLKDGSPCPLCGAIHHPYAENNVPVTTNAEKDLDDLKIKKEDLIAHGSEISKNMGIQETTLENSLNNIKKHNVNIDKQKKKLDLLLQKMELSAVPLNEEITNKCEELDKKQKSLKESKKRAEELERKIKSNQKNQDDIQTDLDELKKNEAKLESAISQQKKAEDAKKNIDESIADINRKKEDLHLGNPDPDQWELELTQNVENARKEYAEANINLIKIEKDQEKQKEDISKLTTNLQTKEIKYKEKENSLLERIIITGFKDLSDFRSAILDVEIQKKYEAQKNEFNTKMENFNGRKTSAQKRYSDTTARKMTDHSKREISAQHEECVKTIEQDQKELTENQQILENQKKLFVNYKELQKDVEEKTKDFDRWDKLNNLIGTEKNTRFVSIVQRLSLERLLDFANEQLGFLNPRYQLVMRVRQEQIPETPLKTDVESGTVSSNTEDSPESDTSAVTKKDSATKSKIKPSKEDSALPPIYCVDTYLANEIRPTNNLSGGETFQVSLALALGLSKMSSKDVTIDSLFLDEGFGTLDKEALDTALDALAHFRISDDSEKTIGIISHVSELSEQIPNKIQINRKGLGNSTMKGPGVSTK